MDKSKFAEQKGLRTGEISLKLRSWADKICGSQKHRYHLLIIAADRLDELEERIAIMTEPREVTEEQLTFPPNDSELK